jgi:hypothetical protein
MNQMGSLAAPICASLQHIVPALDTPSSIASIARQLESQCRRARAALVAAGRAPERDELALATALLAEVRSLLYAAPPPAHRRGIEDEGDARAPLGLASRRSGELARALLAEAGGRLDRLLRAQAVAG